MWTRFGVSASMAMCIALGASLLSALDASAEGPVWEGHPHHLSLVVAGSDDNEATAATLGLDYEYRINELLGLGFVVEHAFEDIDATTLLAVVDVHVWRGFAIQLGPGAEFVHGDHGEEDEQEFAFRIGALYEFEFGHFTFSPQLHYDLTTGKDSVVFGGAFGMSF